MEYRELVSRNWGFIDDELQGAIRSSRVLFAGCGLGSVACEIAARTGFENFVLADGDVVEPSNLNRQAFDTTHLGKNKALSTRDLILGINPGCVVDAHPVFITSSNVDGFIEKADIVVNTIDLDSEEFVLLSRYARQRGKTVLFPANIGFGSFILVFTPEAVSLDEILGTDTGRIDLKECLDRLIGYVFSQREIPPYLRPVFDAFQRRKQLDWPYDPQLGIAGVTSGALLVTAMVKILKGESLSDRPVYIDLWSSLS